MRFKLKHNILKLIREYVGDVQDSIQKVSLF